MAESQSPRNIIPIELRGLKRSPNCTFYRNGDVFFPGERLCINKKQYPTLDAVKDFLTNRILQKIGKPGHIRGIFTPRHGTRVANLEQLEDKGQYVASVNDVYQPLAYNEISSTRPRPVKPKQFDFSNGAIWDREGYAYVQPVLHNDQLRLVSGRARKENENKHAVRIRAYANGDDLTSGCTVCIDRKLHDMDMIKDILALKLNIRAERIFRLDGTEIFDPAGFEPDMRVVCVPRYEEYRGEKFNRFYGEIRPNLTTSPRPTFPTKKEKEKQEKPGLPQKYSVLPPIRGGGESRSTKNGGGSPEHSVNSNRGKRGMAPNSNHATKAKQKRTPDNTRRVDSEKDDGGVYKAKNPNHETRGAKQVKETHETKTDLPIDQRKAEVVKEERIKGENTKGYNNDNLKPKKTDHSNNKQASNKFNDDWDDPNSKNSQFRSSTPSPRKEDASKTKNKGNLKKEEEAATKIQAHFKGYKARQEYNINKTQQKQQKKPQQQQQKQQQQKQEDDRRKQTQQNKKPSMDENKAATKIQAGFRGYKTRKEIIEKKQVRDVSTKDAKTKKEREETGREENLAATHIQAGYRGYKTRKEIKAQKASITKTDTKKDSKKGMSEDEAATKIQAGYRGHKVRQNLKNSKSSTQAKPKVTKTKQGMDKHAAATRVQAGFRGYKARKDMKTKKADQEPSPNRQQGKKYGKTEEDAAAVKIQAGYRGYKARKEYKNSKVMIYEKNVDQLPDTLRILVQKEDTNQHANVGGGDKQAEGGEKIIEDNLDRDEENENENHSNENENHSNEKKNHSNENENHSNENKNSDENLGSKICAQYIIQAAFSGSLTRTYIRELQSRLKREQTKSNRKAIDKRKEILKQCRSRLEKANKAATIIQANAHGFSARQKQKHLKQSRLQTQTPKSKSVHESRQATLIQAAIKGHKARGRLSIQSSSPIIDGNVSDSSKSLLSYQGPTEPEIKQQRKNESIEEKTSASKLKAGTMIQAAFHAYLSRGEMCLGKETKGIDSGIDSDDSIVEDNTSPVNKIQAAFRGYQSRSEVNKYMRKHTAIYKTISLFNETKQISIAIVQAALKAFIVREETHQIVIKPSKLESKSITAEKVKAATSIQAASRGALTRKNWEPMLVINFGKPKPTSQISEEAKAASTIQAYFRAFKERRLKDTKHRTSIVRSAATMIQAAIWASETRQEIQSTHPHDLRVILYGSRKEKDMAQAVRERTELSRIEEEESVIEERANDDMNSRKDSELDSGYTDNKGGDTEDQRSNSSPSRSDTSEARRHENPPRTDPERNEESSTPASINTFSLGEHTDAAIKIQSAHRKYMARKRVQKLREERFAEKRQMEAAIKIQSGYKGYRSRKDMKRIKHMQAVAKIHAVFRGLEARKSAQYIEEMKSLKKRNEAAVVIQSMYRGYRGKTEAKKMKEERKYRKETEAAVKIQAGYRGYKARRTVQVLKAQEIMNTKKEQAAIKIQSRFRGYKTRKEIASVKTQNRRTNAASIIQAAFHTHRVHHETNKILKQDQTKDKDNAVLLIQCVFRGFLCRRELKHKQQERFDIEYEEWKIKRENATTKLQAVWRGHKVRKEIREREDMLPDEFVKKKKDVEDVDEDSLDSDMGEKMDTVQKSESVTEEDESNTETIPEVELDSMREEVKSSKEESPSEKEHSQNQEEELNSDGEDSYTLNTQPMKKGSLPARRNTQSYSPMGYAETVKENVHVKGNPSMFSERKNPLKYIMEQPKKKDEKNSIVMENQKPSPVKEADEEQRNFGSQRQRGRQYKPYKVTEEEESPRNFQSDNPMITPTEELEAPVRLEPILEDTEKIENTPRKRKRETTRRKRKLPPHQRQFEADTELLVLNFDRKKTAEEIEEEQRTLKHTASSIIQAAYHSLKARREHQERLLELKNRNASMIQAGFKFLKIKRASNDYRDNRCATKLQAAYWGFFVRKNTRFRIWNKASVIIQAGVKGLKVRRFRVNKRITETQTKTHAASAIQAGFKATKQHREMRAVKSAKQRVEETHQCAILIQSCFRGYHVRRHLKERQEQIERERQRQLAANTIQSCCRGFIVRKDLKERAHQIKIHTAANNIQSGYQGHKHFTDCQRKRAEERERQRRNKAATRIQSMYKGYRNRTEFIAKRASAVKLQAYYRGHLARKEANRRREERRRNKAALVIQSWYRGHLGRKEASRRQLEKKRKEAAIKIQSHYRGHKARIFVKNKKQELQDIGMWAHNFLIEYMMDYLKMYELRKAAATVVQAHVRGHNTRVWLEKDDDYQWCLCHRRQVRHDAASKIQAHFRGHVTRREMEKEKEFLASLQPPDFSKETLEDYLKKPRRSAARVQAAMRGYLVREEIEVRLYRKAYIKQITPRQRPTSAPELTIGDVAAMTIQSSYRGYVDRSHVRKLRKERWHHAATVIQAVFKAYHARNLKRDILIPVRKKGMIVYQKKAVAMKIAEKAASRIQAGYKMYLLRKQITMLRVEM